MNRWDNLKQIRKRTAEEEASLVNHGKAARCALTQSPCGRTYPASEAAMQVGTATTSATAAKRDDDGDDDDGADSSDRDGGSERPAPTPTAPAAVAPVAAALPPVQSDDIVMAQAFARMSLYIRGGGNKNLAGLKEICPFIIIITCSAVQVCDVHCGCQAHC